MWYAIRSRCDAEQCTVHTLEGSWVVITTGCGLRGRREKKKLIKNWASSILLTCYAGRLFKIILHVYICAVHIIKYYYYYIGGYRIHRRDLRIMSQTTNRYMKFDGDDELTRLRCAQEDPEIQREKYYS